VSTVIRTDTLSRMKHYISHRYFLGIYMVAHIFLNDIKMLMSKGMNSGT